MHEYLKKYNCSTQALAYSLRADEEEKHNGILNLII